MSIEKSVKTSENLFGFPQIESEPNTDNTLILEELSKELQFLLRVLTERKQQRQLCRRCF